MSGQPLRKPTDAERFLQDYLSTLGLQESINEMNLKANEVYKATGQLPPQSQMSDTRTPEDKIKDVMGLKVSIIKELTPLSTSSFASRVVDEIEKSPLNGGNALLVFVAQRIPELVKKLQDSYVLGIKGDINDAIAFVKLQEDMYRKFKQGYISTTSYLNRPQTTVNEIVKRGDYVKVLESYSQIYPQLAILQRNPSLNKLASDVERKISLLDKMIKSEPFWELARDLKEYEKWISQNELYYLRALDKVSVMIPTGRNQGIIRMIQNPNNVIIKLYELMEDLPNVQTLLTIMDQVKSNIKSGNIDAVRDSLERLINALPDPVNIMELLETAQIFNEAIRQAYNLYEVDVASGEATPSMSGPLGKSQPAQLSTPSSIDKPAQASPLTPTETENNTYKQLLQNILDNIIINPNSKDLNGIEFPSEQVSNYPDELLLSLITIIKDSINDPNIDGDSKRKIRIALQKIDEENSKTREMGNMLYKIMDYFSGTGDDPFPRSFNERDIMATTISNIKELRNSSQTLINKIKEILRIIIQKNLTDFIDFSPIKGLLPSKQDSSLFDNTEPPRADSLFTDEPPRADSLFAYEPPPVRLGYDSTKRIVESLTPDEVLQVIEKFKSSPKYEKYHSDKLFETVINDIETKGIEDSFTLAISKLLINNILKKEIDNSSYNEGEIGVKGLGVKRLRGRPKGSVMPKVPFQAKIAVGEGIKSGPRFTPFGKYVLDKNNLMQDVVTLKSMKGGNIIGFPNKKVSRKLGDVFRKMSGGMIPSFDDMASLDEEEKKYLHAVAKKSNLLDKISVPTPNKDERERDLHQFEVMKGEIMSGNDNKEFIKKFKILLMKLQKNNELPKREVNEILGDLAELGY